MVMPDREFSPQSGYRYGFNGKENDNEVKGEGRLQDYGMRSYDPMIGRFISIDPLTKHYPWYTPYQFAGNKPIWATDLDGLEENTSSTYVKKPILFFQKPTFAGTISVTDATNQAAHKTFQGNYAQLKKADGTGLGPSIVDQITSSDVGTSASRLDISMTGTRSEISKTWKGTDIKYFTQYSYTFTNNNVVESGTFEMQTAQIQASARAWDPVTFLLLNKVVSSIIGVGIKTPWGKAIQSTSADALSASKKVYNGTTLYRLGTAGKSATGADAQFWSLENPLSMSAEAYAKKYGVPLQNVQNATFVETATLKRGASYITREAPIAPGAPAGAGGGIEAVVERGGTTGNIITQVKR
jgi:RHS repeat-associated protein